MLTCRFPGLVVVGAVLVGAVAWPREASACEPIYKVVQAWPAGGELPVNAFAVVVGLNIRQQAKLFTVRVGGEPVEFVVSQQLSGESGPLSQLALRPKLPLAIGESWTVQFQADGPAKDVGTYTVAAADETAPAAAPGSLFFDVHDFPLEECSSCGDKDANLWPHLSADAEDGGSPLVHALYVGHPDTDDDTLIAVSRVGAPLPFHHALPASWWTNDQPATEGVCFTLRLLDLAGNEAASALRTCKPCHARIDPMQGECGGFEEKLEPVWTDADLVKGGACTAESAPPLPPEVFPEPGDTDTGSNDSGDTDTGGSDTGAPGTSTSTSTSSEPGTSTSTSTSSEPGTSTSTPTGDVPSPTSSGSSPTSTGANAMTTTAGPDSESAGTAGGAEDKGGCSCRGGGSSPPGLALLGLLALVRRRRGARRG